AGPHPRGHGPGDGARRRHRRRRVGRGRPLHGRGRRRGPEPGLARHRPRAGASARKAVRLRQAGVAALRPHDAQLPGLRPRQQLLSRSSRPRPHAGEAAGLDHARPVDDAARLPHLDPTRHRQGRARRHAVRRVDERRGDRRLRHPRLPLRDPAGRPPRRRLVRAVVPVARPHVGHMGADVVAAARPRLPVAHRAAGDGARRGRLRQPGHADEELVPGRDQQAVRRHRPRQGAQPPPGALRPRVPQRHADRGGRLPGGVHRHLLRRRAADRGDLLPQRPGAARLRGRRESRLPGDVRHPLPLHADRAAAEHRDRSRLHGHRPADRLRAAGRVSLSPLTRRRLASFRASRRGYWALWIFLTLFVLSLGADLLANDRPLLVRHDGRFYVPVLRAYPETAFGGELATEAAYRDPYVQRLIEARGWMVWPPIPYRYDTIDWELSGPAPAAPSRRHWLGTDDEGRDLLARLVYGFRISVLFGLALTLASSVIGVSAGAVQGYFGGWTDLLFQRFMEVWSGLPVLYLLIILASIVQPSFWWLLGLMLLFSWMSLVGVVRAEFLRARNLDYVRAARALGVRNTVIMARHLLPNAMVATLTFLPFILNGAITTLTSLDFLGFGLPPGSASLGEILAQGKANLQAPWLGLTGFIVLAVMLSLLIFIGE